MPVTQRIQPCLWFNTQAEEAARFYTSIFPNSRIGAIAHYGEAGQEFHRMEVGSVMTVEFELDGHRYLALNGGSVFTFNEAVSLMVLCETQDEVDYYWDRLSEGGDPAAQQCGWLKDTFGVSWQVIPEMWIRMASDPDTERVQRAETAMFAMKKFDIAAIQRAYDGVE